MGWGRVFERRDTVSGVGRGEQRRRYDERKSKRIPEHGLRLVVIDKAAFVVVSKRIVRDPARDCDVIREYLRKNEDPTIPSRRGRGPS